MLDTLSTLLRRDVADCTAVSDICPISGTIYGYQPSLPWNALFLAIFAMSTLIHVVQGIHYKTWTFLAAMVIGGFCEILGEAGRVMMHSNPYSNTGFMLQIILLTLAPAFLTAGIYLQLKHLVITFGDSFSRLKPQWYTWIFITCDLFSIALQGAGGGLASGSSDGGSMLNVGGNITIAGLAFQVFTLLIFGILSVEYFLRVIKHKSELNPATFELRRSMRFKFFIGALILAYSTIMIRCVYRVIEMAGGWGVSNSIMREESLFLALDSFMVAIAMLALNAFHPGASFNKKREISEDRIMSGKATGQMSDEYQLDSRDA